MLPCGKVLKRWEITQAHSWSYSKRNDTLLPMHFIWLFSMLCRKVKEGRRDGSQAGGRRFSSSFRRANSCWEIEILNAFSAHWKTWPFCESILYIMVTFFFEAKFMELRNQWLSTGKHPKVICFYKLSWDLGRNEHNISHWLIYGWKGKRIYFPQM